jgi:diphthamide biosynthesis methyltransferase
MKKIQYIRQRQLHTLCLLNIKVKEPDYATMIAKNLNSSTIFTTDVYDRNDRRTTINTNGRNN